jgi:TolA-binding protein
MNQKIKLGVYAALILGAAIFGVLFYSSYKNANTAVEVTNLPPAEVVATALSTNVPGTTNESTNLQAGTNVVPQTNTTVVSPDTNSVTNLPSTNEPSEPVVQTYGSLSSSGRQNQDRSSMIGYFVAFLGISILLGLLIGHDISHYFGGRSVEFMFNDEGTGIKNPEYEEAEQAWANGQHLDAIRMMREYLTKNPREQYVALRIAEIYEKDLKNDLAAALEYEEVLKHKLPPQRWGWAAIHLCNLYFKLHKTDSAVALLRRIVNEYGETPAAEKARKRLALFETSGEEALDGDLPEGAELPRKPAKVEEKQDPNSNLPPGFRPKK